jgi:hypothetical protein
MSPGALALLKRTTGRLPGIITGEWDSLEGYLCPGRPLSMRGLNRLISYDAWLRKNETEFDAYLAAGERSMCPVCEERAVKVSVVATLGGGLPGSEYSALEECENCGYKDLA